MTDTTTVPLAPRALPLELWAVIVLLGAVGGLAAWPALQAFPDAISALGQAGDFLPFAVLILSLVLGLLFFGASCLWLALMLYWADPVARVIAAVLCASAGLALLVEPASRSGDTLVILACLAVVAMLASPNVTRHFAQHAAHPEQPVPVVAARALVLVLCVILGFYGVVFLPIAPLDTKFAFLGAALVALSLLTYRASTRLAGDNPVARTLASVLMVGYGVVLLLTDRSHPAFFIPLGLCLAVVSLLWVPRSSRGLFTPEGTVVSGPVARWNHFADRLQDSVANSGLFSGAPISAGGGRAATTSLYRDLPSLQRPGPMRHVRPQEALATQVVHRDAWQNGGHVLVDELDMRLDSRSWFPFPSPEERVLGQWSASVSGRLCSAEPSHRDAPPPSFRGRSTVVVTTARIMGTCASGESASASLDPETGPVVAWMLAFADLGTVTLEEPTGAPRLAVSAAGASHTVLYVSGPRHFTDGRFQPEDLPQLASVIEEAGATSTIDLPVPGWDDE